MGKTEHDNSKQSKKTKVKMYYKKQNRREGKGYSGSGVHKRGQTGWVSSSQMNTSWGNVQGNRRTFFTAGMKGFLCTTNMRERECVTEAYNILNEYDPPPEICGKKKIFDNDDQEDKANCSSTSVQSDLKEGSVTKTSGDLESSEEQLVKPTEKLAGSNSSESVQKEDESMDEEDDDDDIDKALSKEIKDLKSYNSTRRFLSVDTGVKNVVFVSTTVEDPIKLAEKIYDDIIASGQAKSRNLLRFIPISMTCLPNFEDIKKTLTPMLPQYLGSGFKSFKVECICRCNSKLEVSRGAIINSVADIVTQINPMTFVDLQNPLYTIYIDIVNTVVCLSVLSNFNKYRKYNLVEAAVQKPQKGTEKCISVGRNVDMDTKNTEDRSENTATEDISLAENE